MSDTMTPTPAGWYEDPWGSAAWRYWDGSEWTEHTSGDAQPTSPQTTAAGTPHVPSGSSQDWAPPRAAAPADAGSGTTGAKGRLGDLSGNRFAMVGVAIGAVVLLIVGIGAMSGSEQRSATGEIALFDESSALMLDVGDACEGTGGYSDIQAGLQVRVSDAGGQLIGTGHLDPGQIRRRSVGKACVLEFSVDDIPDSDFYTFEASHRGGLTYSRSEMDSVDWHVSLQLGQ